MFKNVYVIFIIINLKGYIIDILFLFKFVYIVLVGNKRKFDKRINLRIINENELEVLIFFSG